MPRRRERNGRQTCPRRRQQGPNGPPLGRRGLTGPRELDCFQPPPHGFDEFVLTTPKNHRRSRLLMPSIPCFLPSFLLRLIIIPPCSSSSAQKASVFACHPPPWPPGCCDPMTSSKRPSPPSPPAGNPVRSPTAGLRRRAGSSASSGRSRPREPTPPAETAGWVGKAAR